MADDYKAVAAPTTEEPKKTTDDAGDICRTALERYHRWHEREKDNVDEAYNDLTFYAGEQWDTATLDERQGRPCMTINRLPQFVHQVTGDMRQMKPSIKTVPVDSRGDKDTAETIAGMIRYVENRSDAAAIYMGGADSQVVCGTGAWQVIKEYAGESTFNQELRIVGVDDPVSIAWDPDAVLPTREDGKWCIVPTDISRETFEEQYPDAAVEDFETLDTQASAGWFDRDMVRVAAYWLKKPIKRTLALMPDGAIIDLTDATEEELEEAKAAKRIEKRDSFKVCRYLITAAHVLEETDWPGMFIPIVPVIGEEIRIGSKVIRKGLVRDAKDPQRRYNYFISLQTETVALQPKAPWIGTEKQFEKYQETWSTANTKAHPYLAYQPDGQAPPPQRVAPPVSSQGIGEGIALAVEDMKGTIGIYDAGLGQRSNETSGRAIIARQREGDVATFLYVDNWSRAIKHTGRILIDMIPHTYDTERKIRIMGDDGKVDLKDINKPIGVVEIDPATGEQVQVQKTQNDVTIGAYDVVLETGPSYSTKREEAKEGMREFVQAVPQMAVAIMDLYAKAQDWPLAEEIGQRFEAIAPAPVQKLIAQQKKEHGEEVAPQEPSPQDQLQMAAAQTELEGKQLDNQKKKVDIATAAKALQTGEPGQQPDPTAPIKMQGEVLNNQITAEKGRREIAILDLTIEEKTLRNALLKADLAGKAMGLGHKQEEHHAGMTERAINLRHGEESHRANLEREAQPAQ